MNPIDLRSDTVTRPSQEMRSAIAAAPVGDDQYGDDPTVNALQERIAALLGKEAAIWMPSGTMANQVALRTLTHPGDDVVVSREAHAVWHETGGSAANAGVQLTEIGTHGVFTAEEFLAAIKPQQLGGGQRFDIRHGSPAAGVRESLKLDWNRPQCMMCGFIENQQ